MQELDIKTAKIRTTGHIIHDESDFSPSYAFASVFWNIVINIVNQTINLFHHEQVLFCSISLCSSTFLRFGGGDSASSSFSSSSSSYSSSMTGGIRIRRLIFSLFTLSSTLTSLFEPTKFLKLLKLSCIILTVGYYTLAFEL